MKKNNIIVKSMDQSWHSSEILKLIAQETNNNEGIVESTEVTSIKGVKDPSIVTTIALSIAASTLYDMIKYAYKKLCKNEKIEPKITIIVDKIEIDINSIINK